MIRLLKDGQLATGKLISTEATNTTENGKRVHKLTFQLQDDTGREFNTTVETHLISTPEQGREERLLYLPTNPERSMLVDLTPLYLKMSEEGEIAPLSFWRAFPAFIVPLIVIAGHGTYAVIKFITR